MTAELESKMERTEMRMIRWLCDVSLKERQPSTELRRCRSNWGCDEKKQTEVVRICGKKGRCQFIL